MYENAILYECLNCFSFWSFKVPQNDAKKKLNTPCPDSLTSKTEPFLPLERDD